MASRRATIAGHAVQRRRRTRAGRGRPSADRARAPRADSPTVARAARGCPSVPDDRARGSRARTPIAIRIVVVLPAPLAPRNPKIWPAGTSNVSPSSATTRPNVLWRSSMTEAHRPRIARPDPGRAGTMVPGGAMMTRDQRAGFSVERRAGGRNAIARAAGSPTAPLRSTPIGPRGRSRSTGPTATPRSTTSRRCAGCAPARYCRGEAGHAGLARQRARR